MKHFLFFLGVVFFSVYSYAQNLKTHTVKAGESIEGIAKLYKISTADIYALNPDAKSAFVVNTILLIPESFLDKLETTVRDKELLSYKVHKVRRKETLFSIAQKYDLTIEDIKAHNKRLYTNKLRSGKKIYIPIFKELENDSYKNSLQLYTVLAKEGKWRIAYKFGISVPQLDALNPGIEPLLKEGQQINVPNITASAKKQIEEDQFAYYIVKPSEGFYRLKKKLGLSRETLEMLNPELVQSGLKLGMVLKLPKSSVRQLELASTSPTVLADSLVDLSPKNIGILLAFKTKTIDSDSLNLAKEQLKRDGYINISTDFYSGVLVAIDSAKQLGISVNLDVFDTNAKAIDLKRLLSQNNFSKYDAVLGPLTLQNLELTAKKLLNDNIPVVSPFVKSKKSYPNVFQTIPDSQWMRSKMLYYVKSDTIPHNTVIIYDSKNAATANYLKNEFPSASLLTSKINDEDVEQFYLMLEDVQQVLPSGRTKVFLESSNESFISNVTSMLNAMNGITTVIDEEDDEIEIEIERDIILLTTSKNKAFEGLNVSNYDLSNLHFQYPSINFNTSISNSFQENYLNRFGTFPSKYAIRGFDLTLDVLLRLCSFGSLYAATPALKTSYISNKFKYDIPLSGAYKNEAFFILKYEDLEIIKVQD